MTAANAQLAFDSRELARQIKAMRRRHKAAKWPKHEGTKRELIQFLEESAWLLEEAAKTLEGKQ